MRIHTGIGLLACSLIGVAQETPSATTTNAPPVGEAVAAPTTAVMPLIQYVEVPLTTAIDNLARQAGINYILDYKVPYGQIGPDGKPQPQPTLSIRWENLTAEAALAAVLNNYDLQLVADPKTKIARVTRKDPAAPDPLVTRIFQLNYAGVSNLVAVVQSSLSDKRSKAVPDIRTSQLVVVATEKEMIGVDELVQRLDTRTKQVLIEARLIEVSINPKTKKGIDWSGTLEKQNVTFGNGLMTGSSKTATKIPGDQTTTTLPGGRTITTTPRSSEITTLDTLLGSGGLSLNTFKGLTPNMGFLNADGVSAALSFLNTYAESKVLSAPRTVTLDNTPTIIEVGQQYPIINVTAGTQVAAGGSSVSYSNLTVRLEVTPRISADNFVNLKISPRILRLADTPTIIVGNAAFQTYIFDTRMMDTTVMVPSGNTLVMGGLVQDDVRTGNTKVPVLGDIPVLGNLFRYDSKERKKNNLVIFITPTILTDKDYQPAQTVFLKTSQPTKDSVEGDWSPWDTGKPLDWSKPEPLKWNKQPPTFDESLVAPKAP